MNENSLNNINKGSVDFTCRSFTDIDRQSRCLSGYNQQYQQLSCGKFQGHCTSMLLGREFGMYYEVVNQILDQNAAVPMDQYLVIFLMNSRGYCKINGRNFSAGNVFYAGPGATVSGISGPGTHSVVISLEKTFFDSVLSNCYPKIKYGLMIPESGIIKKSQSDAQTLRQTTKQMLSVMQASPSILLKTSPLKNLRQSMAEMIAVQIHQAFCLPEEKKTVSLSHRFSIVQHACEFIYQQPERQLSISDLCRETGVSRRTLEYSFRECIGQSPNAYLRSIKLNGIRRALLSSENADKSIGDIAAEWGVWHLSRFAHYYKNQFHELPSETREGRSCDLAI